MQGNQGNNIPESDGEYAKRVTVYKHLLKGVAFFSNGDTISSVASSASETFAGKTTPVNYKYSGGGSIAASSLAILIILAIYIKKWCIDSEARQRAVTLPTTYLIFLLISCILSIVGNALLITDQNSPISSTATPKPPEGTDLHVAGAILFALAKMINPAFTSTLVVADSLEQNADNQANAGGNPPQNPGGNPPQNPGGNPPQNPGGNPPQNSGGNPPQNPRGIFSLHAKGKPPQRDVEDKNRKLKKAGYIDSAITDEEKESLVGEEDKELDNVVSAEAGLRKSPTKT